MLSAPYKAQFIRQPLNLLGTRSKTRPIVSALGVHVNQLFDASSVQAKPNAANDQDDLHTLIGLGQLILLTTSEIDLLIRIWSTGPDFGSQNFLAFGATVDTGDTPLANIFKQEPSTPNFISFILGRADENSKEPIAAFPGELTIGEIIPGYEAISNQPKLTIPKNVEEKRNQHYSALLDNVKVRGKTVTLPPTTVSGNNGKPVAVFDSGFSLPQVPKCVASFYVGLPWLIAFLGPSSMRCTHPFLVQSKGRMAGWWTARMKSREFPSPLEEWRYLFTHLISPHPSVSSLAILKGVAA
jgi:hypothetical protein